MINFRFAYGRDVLIEARAMAPLIWPMLIAQLAQMGTGVVDTIMAGRYSALDLTAVAIGYNIWLPLFLMTLGVLLATTNIVAYEFGAGRKKTIRDFLPQSIWVALALGAILGPTCYFVEPILNLLNLDVMTQNKTADYLKAVAFGIPASAIFQALRCHTQGIGIIKPFAWASVIGFIANVPLNYAFIYGKWGIPEMGAAGCGWATAISMWLGPILISFYIAKSSALSPYIPEIKIVKPNYSTIKNILTLGIPIGLTFFLEVLVFSIIGLMIATLGNAPMAAHQIAFNIWDVLYIPLLSVGMAMMTRVGHGLGEGNASAVNLSIKCGFIIVAIISGISMAILLITPEPIISIYTKDREITVVALTLLRLSAFFIIIDAIQVTCSFCLRAFKETRYPFIVMCLSYWCITLPIGVWFGLLNSNTPLEGATNFWKAMIVGITVAALLVGSRLRYLLSRPLI